MEQGKQECISLLKKHRKRCCSFDVLIYKYKMTYYNSLNVKLSNSKLNKLKLEIQKETKVTSYFLQILWVILMMKLIFHMNC